MVNKSIPRTGEELQALDRQDQPLGFWIGLRLRPGVPWREELEVERMLEDRLAALGLRIGGGAQRQLFIEAADRELSLADQIDVVDWCLCHTPATQVAVSSLTAGASRPLPVTIQVMRVERFNLASLHVSWLYRMGRLRADQYAEISGGFVAAPDGELFA